jgi:tRNA(Ile)-lysidine synthase
VIVRAVELGLSGCGATGVVAISGGPDSVALAAACRSLLASGRITRLHLAHVNHGLRGAESDEDERFVRELAGSWSLPLVVARREIAGSGIEEAARDARYEWLTATAREVSAEWIATGHTADDQAETVLHRLVRGTGLSGLSGIAPVRMLSEWVALVRPLLDVKRSDLLAFLAAEGISYRVDSSNADVRFTRNRIRHELLPTLARDFNPAIVDILGRLAKQAAEWQETISRRAKELLAEVERQRADHIVVLSWKPLATMSPMWVREIVRTVWRREEWPEGAMTFEDWECVSDIIKCDAKPRDFPDGVRIRLTQYVVQLWRDVDSGGGC